MLEQLYRVRKYLEDRTPRSYAGYRLSVLPSVDPRTFQYGNIKTPLTFDQLPAYTLNKEQLRDREVKYDQGSLGECICAALVMGQKTQQEVRTGTYPVGGLSVEWAYAKMKNIDGMPDTAGSQPLWGYKTLQKYGTVRENNYPRGTLARDTNVADPPDLPENKYYRFGNYAQLAAEDDVNRDSLPLDLASALVREGVVGIAVLITESFFDVKRGGQLPLPAGKVLGAHMMRLVDYSKTTDGFAFEVWNSWGSNYDEFLISEEFIKHRVEYVPGHYFFPFMEAWTALDDVLPISAKEIIYTPGDLTAYVDGVPISMPIAPKIVGSHMLVPARAIAAAMGYQVRWDGRNGIFIKP